MIFHPNRSGDRIIDMTDSILEELMQEELGSVVFVMDYLQLDFVNARFMRMPGRL